MSDAPPQGASPLSYSRGVVEKIRASYEKLSRDELLDMLCYVSKTYIVEQTIPFDIPLPERAEAEEKATREKPPEGVPEDEAIAAADPELAPHRRFARLIEGLKKRTQLPQLEGFSVEDGRCTLVVDNQKVTFGERVTVEFVPTAPRRRPPTNAAIPIPDVAREAAPSAPARPAAASPFDAERAPPIGRPQPPREEPGARVQPKQGPLARPEKAKPGAPAPDKPKDRSLEEDDHIKQRFQRPLDLD